MPATGGLVEFEVKVFNAGVRPVLVTSIVDDVFGTLDGRGTCGPFEPPLVISAGGFYMCSFSEDVLPGHSNTVTVTVGDGETTVEVEDTADVGEVPPVPTMGEWALLALALMLLAIGFTLAGRQVHGRD